MKIPNSPVTWGLIGALLTGGLEIIANIQPKAKDSRNLYYSTQESSTKNQAPNNTQEVYRLTSLFDNVSLFGEEKEDEFLSETNQIVYP